MCLLICLLCAVCFRVFDQDRDGELTWEEFVDFIRCQLLIEGQNREADPEEDQPEVCVCPLCIQ